MSVDPIAGHRRPLFPDGLLAAGISAILSGMRSLASSRTRNGWVMVKPILLVWALGLSRLAHPMQLLPLIGTTTGTWGLFRLQGIALRLCLLCGTVLWFVHNLRARLHRRRPHRRLLPRG